MLINKIYEAAQFMLSKLHRGYVDPDSFNSAMKYVQNKKFIETFSEYNKFRNRAMAGYLPTEQYNRLKELKSILIKLYKTEVLVLEPGGKFFLLPSDFNFEDIILFGNTPVTELTIEGYADRSGISLLDVVDLDFITYIKDNEGIITVPQLSQSQLDETPLEVFYFRMPNDPIWRYLVIEGKSVFDPSTSVDVDISEAVFDEVVREILIYLGVEVKDAGVSQSFQKEESSKTQVNDQIQ